jgi:ABC-type transport system substrate-binding protein
MTNHTAFDVNAARQLTKEAVLDIDRAYEGIVDNIKSAAASGRSRVLSPFPSATMSRTQAETIADRLRKVGFNTAVTEYGPENVAIEASW